MVLHIQLRQLSTLQSFDNKMDDLYKDGLPEDPSAGRVGPKQKAFIRKRRTMARKLDGTLLRQYERMRQSRIKGNAIVPVINGCARGATWS